MTPITTTDLRSCLPQGALSLGGFALLLVWTLTRLWQDDLGDISGQLLVLLSAGWLLTGGRALWRSRLLQLLLLALLIQLASWGLSHLLHPDLAERSPKLDRLAAWFFLIPVALFCAASRQRVMICWACALGALLLSPWLSGDGWKELLQGLNGERVHFGLLNAQHSGMLFGIGLLGALMLPAPVPATTRRGVVLGRLLRLLLITATAFGMLLSQTRGIWLALLCSVPLALLLRSRLRQQQQADYISRPLRRLAWFSMTFVVIIITPLGGIIEDRLRSEGPLAGYDGEGFVLQENVRVRLSTWHTAMDWIVQRPLLGWGGKGRAAVVQDTEALSDNERQRFRHLHSTYLDTLVNWGLAGLAVLLGLFAWLGLRLRRSWQQGSLDTNLLCFGVAFGLYWGVANAFESFMFYQSGLYALALIAGGLLALCNTPEEVSP
ncbi:O-antigen ligase family protein [Parahaliea maris]|uniref:O-antigen ligase family protein n=1 Tax=Parahaliea maris TaxID=2716870 RepID=A0A5C8ZZD2_9GAMM|nr:O-antigen ligase family protein [Parahaliea maris]TXS93963.1 O-antigen ligase family protein [Parahaliea maris]